MSEKISKISKTPRYFARIKRAVFQRVSMSFARRASKFRSVSITLLLAVLVLSALPIPERAEAAVAITKFEVPNQTFPASARAEGLSEVREVDFTAEIDISSLTCPQGKRPRFEIQAKEGSIPDYKSGTSEGIVRSYYQFIDPAQSRNKPIISYTGKALFNYRSGDSDPVYILPLILCGDQSLSGPLPLAAFRNFDNYDEVSRGNPILVRPDNVIEFSELKKSTTVVTTAKAYIFPKDQYLYTANQVSIKVKKFEIKTPSGKLVQPGSLIRNGNLRTAKVESFQLLVDKFGKNSVFWHCDGWLVNDCDAVTKEPFTNPFPRPDSSEGPREIKFKFSNEKGDEDPNSDIFYIDPKDAQSDVVVFPIAITPTLIVEGGVDIPIENSARIEIKLDSKATEPKEEGGEGGVVSGGTPTELTSGTTLGTLGDIAGGPLISIVNIAITVTTAILRWVLWAIGSVILVPILEATLQLSSSDLAGGPIIVGWTFVRDVVNMLFILALIVIGLGTMLRLESYNYKKLLVNVIAMALLVNFSLLIARIILQIADAAQFSFVPPTDETEGLSAVRYIFDQLSTTHVSTITGPLGLFSGFSGINNALAVTFTLIFQTILEFGIVATFGALAIFMVIRTVAIWFLLILSPVAYALQVLPQTASYASKWWENFIKYALFAPLMTFFLRITLVLYSDGFGLLQKLSGQPVPAVTSGGNIAHAQTQGEAVGSLGRYIENYFNGVQNPSFTDVLALVGIYVLVIGFLWGALLVTRTMGIAGAAAITGVAAATIGAPLAAGKWLGGRGLGALGQKWNEWTPKILKETGKDEKGRGIVPGWRKLAFAMLNPKATYKGFQERAHERQEQARVIAEGAGLEIASELWTRGKERLPYQQMARRRVEREMVKKLREAISDDIDKAEAQDLLVRVTGVGGLEGELLRGAVKKIGAQEGYLDDQHETTAAEIRDGMKKAEDEAKASGKTTVDPDKKVYKQLTYAQAKKINEDGELDRFNDQAVQTLNWVDLELDYDVLKNLREDKDYEGTGGYHKWLDQTGNQEKLRQLGELTNLAKAVGHFEQMYMTVRDPKKGIWKPVVDSRYKEKERDANGKLTGRLTNTLLDENQQKNERTEQIMGEFKKTPIRDLMRKITWHNMLPKEFAHYFNLGDTGINALSKQGVAQNIIDKLQGLKGKDILGAENFAEELEKALGEADFVKLGSQIAGAAKTDRREWTHGRAVDRNGKSLLTHYQQTVWKTLEQVGTDQATHMQPRTLMYTIGKWVNEDAGIKHLAQYEEVERLAPTFSDALRKMAAYGRPRPTAPEIAEFRDKAMDRHVEDILKHENVPLSYGVSAGRIYRGLRSGSLDMRESIQILKALDLDDKKIIKVLDDIAHVLGQQKASDVDSHHYLPPAARAGKEALPPDVLKDFDDAVKRGIVGAFKGDIDSANMTTKKNLTFGSDELQDQLKTSIEIEIKAALQDKQGKYYAGFDDKSVAAIARELGKHVGMTDEQLDIERGIKEPPKPKTGT